MAKHKSLVISAEVVNAGRKRKCVHSHKHAILKGDLCLEVKEKLSLKGYCVVCASAMIGQAQDRLTQLKTALTVTSTPS